MASSPGGPDNQPDHLGDMHTPGLPISHKGKLSAELAADGTLVLELAAGEKTNLLAPYVGTHALW